MSNYIDHPASGKAGTFAAKYDQHAERNGQNFTVLGAVDPSAYDVAECGEMFSIRFADGVQIEAWPEEVESAMKFAEMPKNGYFVATTPVFQQIERPSDWRKVNATTLNGAKRAAVTLATSATFSARVAIRNEAGEFHVIAQMHNSSAITRRRAVWRDSKVVMEGGESPRLDDAPSP